MDSQSSIAQIVALAGLIRTLVFYIQRSTRAELTKNLPEIRSHWVDRDNYYRASQSGLDAKLITDAGGEVQPILDLINAMLDAISPSAELIGETGALESLGSIMRDDQGYRFQERIYAETGAHFRVVAALIDSLETELHGANTR